MLQFCFEYVVYEFLSQKPVTRSFDVVFDLCQKKRLSKQRYAGDLRHNRAHYDVTVVHMCWQCGPSLFREMDRLVPNHYRNHL